MLVQRLGNEKRILGVYVVNVWGELLNKTQGVNPHSYQVRWVEVQPQGRAVDLIQQRPAVGRGTRQRWEPWPRAGVTLQHDLSPQRLDCLAQLPITINGIFEVF